MVRTKVRVRFAPSPTGYLHVGGARTAIYNWLFARQHGGKFILRIEDTDISRNVEGAIDTILSSLRWLGLEWDEGPQVGGDYGPYFQSQRTYLYAETARKLLSADRAYRCFCAPKKLEERRQQALREGRPPGYDGRCGDLTQNQIHKLLSREKPFALRFRATSFGDLSFRDLIHGEIAFKKEAVNDFIIVRSDGTPTYNFTVVVDDALMQITHVIRGDDHLSNTPKQIPIYKALGYPRPEFAHIPLILGKDGSRLSKRHGATAVEAFREEGFLPQAMVNYLALLGWSYDDRTTLFSVSELIDKFSLEKVSKNPAIFDLDKLEWMNGVYIREKSDQELAELLLPYIRDIALVDGGGEGREEGEEHLGSATGNETLSDTQTKNILAPRVPEAEIKRTLLKIIPLVRERIKKLSEVQQMADFFFTEDYPLEKDAMQKFLKAREARKILQATLEKLRLAQTFSSEEIEELLRQLPDELGLKAKQIFQTIRAAVTGKTVSPPLFQSLAILGKEKSLNRIAKVLSILEEGAEGP
ncbi:glutamyl-tRNA synthetase [Candidatus Hakubella thermalkaliphila]|uniref:Glutamate--tRNA ligase n=1 Tax=Candidatus Hakubella thermalkaliphila TaxID=2754717 RepID=A0A6V8Q2I9_9ACTN|nr:glutamate--tRNA ligase [Candidatus Hakubella thermalkaliphila]GFP18757.1 glutamyl-tRNA synthetase [Candidatus Hakubella thermalkaliphila]GFP30406.1 glutamyl-tRNA synthetase [Candidatus Hakubella thermalkaliphila]GFP38908.1 glutamyl-tRNA synthetase [Candidatus Hakubella thermalkaliphila]